MELRVARALRRPLRSSTQLTGVRKLFSILLSALFNGASLLPTQWFGVAVAFYAIAYSNVHASRRLGSYGTAMERSACREALETGRRRAVEKGADGVMGADGRDGRENEKRFGKTADGVMGADGRGGKRREGGSGIEIETRVERSVDGESEGRKRKDAIWKEIENGDTEMGVEEEESRSDCSMSAAWGSRDRTRRDATGLNGDVRRRRGRRWKSQTEVEAVSSSTG